MTTREHAKMKAHRVQVDIEGLYYAYHDQLTTRELRDVQDARTLFESIVTRLREAK